MARKHKPLTRDQLQFFIFVVIELLDLILMYMPPEDRARNKQEYGPLAALLRAMNQRVTDVCEHKDLNNLEEGRQDAAMYLYNAFERFVKNNEN